MSFTKTNTNTSILVITLLLIQRLLRELTGCVVPCFETAAWYLAIFSLRDDDSITLSDTDGPKADKKITLNALSTVNYICTLCE